MYLLYNDDHGVSGFFHELGLGMFWVCGARQGAKEFATRRAAAQLLHANGKHREGWRVISADLAPRTWDELAKPRFDPPRRAPCELCGEPSGEGNALCPACQEAR